MLVFVKTWWIDHITGADKQYAPYVLAEQLRQSGETDATAPDEAPEINPEVAELLDVMIESERQIGCYYDAMEGFIPEHEATWRTLSQQERQHAAALVNVLRAAEGAPHRVAPGRFTAAAARHMIRDVAETIQKIEQGEIHPRYALSFIRDIEQALLENHVDQAVETDDPEIRAILQKLWARDRRASRHPRHGHAVGTQPKKPGPAIRFVRRQEARGRAGRGE